MGYQTDVMEVVNSLSWAIAEFVSVISTIRQVSADRIPDNMAPALRDIKGATENMAEMSYNLGESRYASEPALVAKLKQCSSLIKKSSTEFDEVLKSLESAPNWPRLNVASAALGGRVMDLLAMIYGLETEFMQARAESVAASCALIAPKLTPSVRAPEQVIPLGQKMLEIASEQRAILKSWIEEEPVSYIRHEMTTELESLTAATEGFFDTINAWARAPQDVSAHKDAVGALETIREKSRDVADSAVRRQVPFSAPMIGSQSAVATNKIDSLWASMSAVAGTHLRGGVEPEDSTPWALLVSPPDVMVAIEDAETALEELAIAAEDPKTPPKALVASKARVKATLKEVMTKASDVASDLASGLIVILRRAEEEMGLADPGSVDVRRLQTTLSALRTLIDPENINPNLERAIRLARQLQDTGTLGAKAFSNFNNDVSAVAMAAVRRATYTPDMCHREVTAIVDDAMYLRNTAVRLAADATANDSPVAAKPAMDLMRLIETLERQRNASWSLRNGMGELGSALAARIALGPGVRSSGSISDESIIQRVMDLISKSKRHVAVVPTTLEEAFMVVKAAADEWDSEFTRGRAPEDILAEAKQIVVDDERRATKDLEDLSLDASEMRGAPLDRPLPIGPGASSPSVAPILEIEANLVLATSSRIPKSAARTALETAISIARTSGLVSSDHIEAIEAKPEFARKIAGQLRQMLVPAMAKASRAMQSAPPGSVAVETKKYPPMFAKALAAYERGVPAGEFATYDHLRLLADHWSRIQGSQVDADDPWRPQLVEANCALRLAIEGASHNAVWRDCLDPAALQILRTAPEKEACHALAAVLPRTGDPASAIRVAAARSRHDPSTRDRLLSVVRGIEISQTPESRSEAVDAAAFLAATTEPARKTFLRTMFRAAGPEPEIASGFRSMVLASVRDQRVLDPKGLVQQRIRAIEKQISGITDPAAPPVSRSYSPIPGRQLSALFSGSPAALLASPHATRPAKPAIPGAASTTPTQRPRVDFATSMEHIAADLRSKNQEAAAEHPDRISELVLEIAGHLEAFARASRGTNSADLAQSSNGIAEGLNQLSEHITGICKHLEETDPEQHKKVARIRTALINYRIQFKILSSVKSASLATTAAEDEATPANESIISLTKLMARRLEESLLVVHIRRILERRLAGGNGGAAVPLVTRPSPSMATPSTGC